MLSRIQSLHLSEKRLSVNLQYLLFTAFVMFCELPEKRLSVEERGSPSARQQLANLLTRSVVYSF